jgi:uncharacterized protein (DUF433 family)
MYVLDELTPAQASYVTGLALKAVNKAIENREIPATVKKEGRITRRYVPYSGVVCLELSARGLKSLPLRIRKDVFKRVAKNPKERQIRYNEALIVDVKGARARIEKRLAEVRKLKQVITVDQEVMGGAPVFRGTRIPVYSVAEMLERGAKKADILSGYPALNAEMVRLSRVYMRVFPRRGRPIAQPWQTSARVRRKRGKLSVA